MMHDFQFLRTNNEREDEISSIANNIFLAE
jgi:hypothetical protein